MNLFSQDPVSKERVKRTVRMRIDLDAQLLAEVKLKADEVQEGGARRKVHKQVEIARYVLFPSCV